MFWCFYGLYLGFQGFQSPKAVSKLFSKPYVTLRETVIFAGATSEARVVSDYPDDLRIPGVQKGVRFRGL